jgi:hypothetical protein
MSTMIQREEPVGIQRTVLGVPYITIHSSESFPLSTGSMAKGISTYRRGVLSYIEDEKKAREEEVAVVRHGESFVLSPFEDL